MSEKVVHYAELGWQEATVVGAARQEGILQALADKGLSAEDRDKARRVEEPSKVPKQEPRQEGAGRGGEMRTS